MGFPRVRKPKSISCFKRVTIFTLLEITEFIFFKVSHREIMSQLIWLENTTMNHFLVNQIVKTNESGESFVIVAFVWDSSHFRLINKQYLLSRESEMWEIKLKVKSKHGRCSIINIFHILGNKLGRNKKNVFRMWQPGQNTLDHVNHFRQLPASFLFCFSCHVIYNHTKP